MTRPSVGRVVHYVSYGTPGGEYPSVCRAAIVTEVGGWVTVDERVQATQPARRVLTQEYDEDTLTLHVINPSGLLFNATCRRDELPPADKIVFGERTTHQGGTWHWPERVD